MRNAVEEIVAREFERLKQTDPEFCSCDMCRDDVLAYTLNRLPPQYCAQLPGAVIVNFAMESDQRMAHVAVVILEGIKRVKAKPRRGHGEANGP